MREKSFVALIGAVVISALVGCGGNVVVDGPGGDGGGGGSATTTGTDTGSTGTTGSTGVTTTTTTVSPPSYCSLVCNQADIYGCLGGSSQAECQEGCVQVFQQYAGCEGELKALYDCVIAQFENSCDVGAECDAQAQKLNDCTGGGTNPCEEYGCSGSEGYCSCEGECNGKYLVTECKDDANGYSTCSCTANGEYLGTCDQFEQSCGIFESCCTGYFFQKK